jgi:hypothetical protein
MNARALALVLLVAAAPRAVADSSVPGTRAPAPAPSPADRELARRLFMEGVQLYDAQKYGEAALRFERAYAAAPEPVVLFNIGQARRQHGDAALALRAYRGFLRDKPDTPNRQKVEELIAALEHPDGGAPR